MISVSVTLTGHVTDEDVERAVEFVQDITGGTPGVTVLDELGPRLTLVGGHGPGVAQ